MRALDKDKALVVLSGGQDSATCLAWAKETFNKIYAVSFNYGQRHKIELECAKKLGELAGVEKHWFLDVKDMFSKVTESDLMKVNTDINNKSSFDDSLPASFVPFRNAFFLTMAASLAYINKIQNIVTGVCQTDYSGYPDCRDSFVKSLNAALAIGGDCNVNIITPLMWLNKAETVLLMKELGYLSWYKYTNTCYNGNKCQSCPACELRAKGFAEAGIPDPLFE